VIRFGLSAAKDPHNLSQEKLDELRALGITNNEIYEIIATANLFTGVNQYTDAIALEVDAL
jgi:alkylhydroperoxidase family enzyme